jgi:hypothetical protein
MILLQEQLYLPSLKLEPVTDEEIITIMYECLHLLEWYSL